MGHKEFFVRPLGKYGHLYVVNAKTYRVYKACAVISLGILAALVLGEIIVSGFPILPVSSTDIFIAITIFVPLMILVHLKIAGHGEIIYGPKAESIFAQMRKRRRSSRWAGIYKTTLLASSAVGLTVCCGTAVIEFFQHSLPPSSLWILILLFTIGFIRVMRW